MFHVKHYTAMKGSTMDYKTATTIIQKRKQEANERNNIERAAYPAYRLYTLTPFTKLRNALPHKDYRVPWHRSTESVASWIWYQLSPSCDIPEVEQAVKDANAGKVGVFKASYWKKILLERL